MVIEIILFQVFLFVIAFISNSLSAFAGGGAGLIQLPMLIFLGLPFSVALATHKVASVSLGVGASIRHFQDKALKQFLSLFILACGIPGVIAGSSVVLLFSERLSLIILGLLTFSIGLYSSTNSQLGIEDNEIQFSKKNLIVGGSILFVLGFLNGSFSSGTGLFVTLWLVRWFGLSYTKSIGYTLLLVGLFWNGTGAFVLGLNGKIEWSWLPMLLMGSLSGGYLGAHFSILKGNKFVKLIFEIVSLLVGLSLLVRAFF